VSNSLRSESIVQESARPKGEKRRSPWSLLLVVLLVLAVLVIVPFMLLRPEADVFTVRSFETAVVESGTLVEYVRGGGTLVPRHERSLLAPGAGVLAVWLVAEGDEVLAGALLGHLDSPELQREVADREADLAQAERRVAELALEHGAAERAAASLLARLERELAAAEAEITSVRALFELGAAARSEVDAAEQAVLLAERALAGERVNQRDAEAGRELARTGAAAAVERAQEAVLLAQGQAGALELRSPITGRVIELFAAVGEGVAARAVLVTVAGTDDLRVDAEFSESQARLLAVGQPANLWVAGVDYAGSVAQVAQQAHSSSGGGQVVRTSLVFDEPPAGLRLGASASVEVETGRKDDALYLPRGPYLTTGGERLAFVVEGSEARRETVVFGLVDGNRVEVRSGLEAGERVITSSYEAFKEYTSVKLAPEGEVR
jgi:HlyD family secretion protein